jgi:hypothetical protein
MKRCIQLFILFVFYVLVIGCTFLSQEDEVKGFTAVELNSIIEKYETEKEEPKNIKIGEVYAMRSMTHAHHNPIFEASRSCILTSRLFYTFSLLGGHGFTPAGSLGIVVGTVSAVATPVAFVWDAVTYPFQACKTLAVSDDDINKALLDLNKARKLGYNKGSPPGIRLGKHLDKLGYELEEDQ